MQNDNKIACITFLQSFAVVLVVAGHCLPEANLGDTFPLWASILHNFVYSFHMPLFFAIAGYLFSNSFKRQSISIKNFKIFIRSKLKRIIVPYISIGTLAYLLKVFIFNKFAYRPCMGSFVDFIKSILIPWDNPCAYLWFLPTIFFIYILGYLILNKNNYNKIDLFLWMIFSFVISFLSNYTDIGWLNISGIFNYLFYFFMGILFFDFKEILFKYLSNQGLIVFIILLFFELQILPSLKSGFYHYFLNCLTAILGILFSFIIANYCAKRDIKFLSGIIDGLYYQIYLLSWFFICGARLFYQMHLVNYPTVSLIMFISSFIFPIPITLIIKKYIPKLKIFIGL